MTAGIFGAVLMTVFGTYYFRNKKSNRKRALLCKALATSVPGFLLLGSRQGAELWGTTGTLLAILLYMAADVLLECRFVWGAVCFSIGHICMAAGFLLSGESILDLNRNGRLSVETETLCLTLVIFAFFVAVACAALHRYFYALKKKKLYYPLLAYILILSMMSALAVAAGVRICCGDAGETAAVRGLIPAAGGICFAVSDVLLGRNRLGKHRSVAYGALVLVLYYAAVYLFSMRLWL